MSLEQHIEKLTAAMVDLTAKTDALINLRVEGLAKVEQAAAAPATKPKASKAAETKAEEPALNITATPEDRKDPANPEPATTTAAATTPAATAPNLSGLSETALKNVIQGYVTSGSPDPTADAAEIEARKAEVFKLYDLVGAKLEPPREPGKTKLSDVPPEKYEALSKRIAKLVEELAAKGGRLVAKAAPADDDL